MKDPDLLSVSSLWMRINRSGCMAAHGFVCLQKKSDTCHLSPCTINTVGTVLFISILRLLTQRGNFVCYKRIALIHLWLTEWLKPPSAELRRRCKRENVIYCHVQKWWEWWELMHCVGFCSFVTTMTVSAVVCGRALLTQFGEKGLD